MYDLRNQNFDLEEDFFNIAFKYDKIPGQEIPEEEPILFAYYVTKWNYNEPAGEDRHFIDFNLLWAGVLTSETVKAPILSTSVVSAFGEEGAMDWCEFVYSSNTLYILLIIFPR